MPSHSQYDIAIVGASIAGCEAAIFFGRAGARVALIERDRDPAGYKRLCTHYIQASATPRCKDATEHAITILTLLGHVDDSVNYCFNRDTKPIPGFLFDEHYDVR
jgi:flavin-dependent dehydrogenase